jgi:hypothetical protein
MRRWLYRSAQSLRIVLPKSPWRGRLALTGALVPALLVILLVGTEAFSTVLSALNRRYPSLPYWLSSWFIFLVPVLSGRNPPARFIFERSSDAVNRPC